MPDRDIAWVIVTGAGASRDLGRDAPMPLMRDWSTALVKALAAAPAMNLVQLTGLSPEMDGPAFEQQLGKFLNERAAFAQVRDITVESKNLSFGQFAALNHEGALETWWSTVDNHLEQAVDVIRGSLYSLFGEDRLDWNKASAAYGELLQVLGIGRDTPWVYATTNYDSFGEVALEQLGFYADWGEPPRVRQGGDRVVDVNGLVGEHLSRYVPVLHLHGRLGWYRRADGYGPTGPYAISTTRHDPGYGIPIVMLPNPVKPYESDDVVGPLWRQFGHALERAKRVLVIGHSLNDEQLVRLLLESVEPQTRIGVTVVPSTKTWEDTDPGSQSVVDILQSRLPGAKAIRLRFGASLEPVQSQIGDWMAHLKSLGAIE
jgi:hypothetical protein